MTPTQEDLDAVRDWLRRQSSPLLNPGGLLGRIQKGAGLSSRLLANKCLRELDRLCEVTCAEWGPHEPLARVRITLPDRELPYAEANWRAAVDARPGLSVAERDAFYRLWPALADWPSHLHEVLITELLAIRERPVAGTAYLTSAAGNLASSKLLSALPRQPLRDIGIAVDSLPSAPPCFLIAGGATPEAVVLVENPNAFERAIAATANLPVCWISAYGFGAGALDAGDRLAEGLERPHDLLSAVRSGSPPPLNNLLTHHRIFHWGDLDVAGLQIFWRARIRLPALRLSALYRPMISLLNGGGGHPYVAITGKAEQRTDWTPSEPGLRTLVDLCRHRAVDQEYVCADDICESALWPLYDP